MSNYTKFASSFQLGYNEKVLILIILLSFLIGSIPFGQLVAKAYHIDLREHGSGNVGATNVVRTLGKGPGALVFALDFLKGVLATWIAALLIGTSFSIASAGFFVILGHIFSPFLNFKGGKGVATGIGTMVFIAPEIFAVCFLVWIIVFALTRYVSLGSLIVAVLVIVLMLVFNKPLPLTLGVICSSLLIISRHSSNIKRLRSGTESSFKK
jgi:glycerol-3-phosphate acyltransferase PlsY